VPWWVSYRKKKNILIAERRYRDNGLWVNVPHQASRITHYGVESTSLSREPGLRLSKPPLSARFVKLMPVLTGLVNIRTPFAV